MKRINLSLLFILISGSFALAQNDKAEFYFPVDTVFRHQGIILPLKFKYDLDELYYKQLLPQMQDNLLFNNDTSSIWLRTELALSYPYLSDEKTEINNHFTSPLYKQYLKDSEFDMVRYVLGMAQLSAVAYMAYRHIKKYGFWK